MPDRLSQLRCAFHLLSRLPVPAEDGDHTRGADAAWAYPLVGLTIGALAALVMALAAGLGLPAPLAAILAVATQIMLTGAMHEDGLADMADGFWGGWDRERRLDIMRDSRIGSYGVIALVIGLVARIAALWLLLDISTGWAAAALVATGALSRATMPALMALLPHARGDGLSHGVGAASREAALAAAAAAAAFALVLLGWSALPALFWTVLVAVIIGALANRKLGGQTGDVLGGTQQIAEIAILFSLAA